MLRHHQCECIGQGRVLLLHQEYFVKRRKEGQLGGIRFKGIRKAPSTPEVNQAIKKAALIVLSPSNPVVSILPILSLRGFRDLLRGTTALKVAISPFIGNRAGNGPVFHLFFPFLKPRLVTTRWGNSFHNSILLFLTDP